MQLVSNIHGLAFGMLSIVLLNPELSISENTADPDQLENLAEILQFNRKNIEEECSS